jgi:hypothetical protein
MKIPEGEPSAIDHKTPGPAWFRVRSSDGRPLKPLIKCGCGRIMGIALHSVSAAGEVRASFYHPVKPLEAGSLDTEPGCGFHEFLELEGYDGPAFGPWEGR